jgi:Ion channel
MVASLFMSISIMGNYQLFIRWQRTKNFIIETDNLFNTGLYKIMIIEVCAVLVQPYPFLQGVIYKEAHMYGDKSANFEVNDLLLCWMIFSRVYFYARSILSLSFYTDPRSQRVCTIYGAEAGYTFALKALMKEKPWNVLACSLLMSVFVFGYCLRLFERVIQPEFDYVSTSMWNVLITMTTVGYGDYFAQTHCGRVVAIICAFWGVFIVSLFVVALTNMLEFNPPENKAYMLLFRLRSKEQLRYHAADMLAAKYRLKLIRKQGKFDTTEKLKMERKYRHHK